MEDGRAEIEYRRMPNRLWKGLDGREIDMTYWRLIREGRVEASDESGDGSTNSRAGRLCSLEP